LSPSSREIHQPAPEVFDLDPRLANSRSAVRNAIKVRNQT
jgi:hypothetical protein